MSPLHRPNHLHLADNARLMNPAVNVMAEVVNPPAAKPAKIRWKPSVTVAAVIERDGRFLLVEEDTADGLMLNNPAGHLDLGESPEQGVVRETLEETACHFTPEAFLGVFMSRFRRTRNGEDTTYLRLAFCGTASEPDLSLSLDEGIVRTLWMTVDELRACPERHRSPLVLACIETYLNGTRLPLSAVLAHDSVFSAPTRP